MAVVAESWVSEVLYGALAVLSPGQAAGVLRIVKAELEGRGVSSLLDCEGQICTSTTYYNRKRGWVHKPAFQQALALARRDYRGWALEWGGRDALAILAQTAPDAARALRHQVGGDAAAIEGLIRILQTGSDEERVLAAAALGQTELMAVAPGLLSALESERAPAVRGAIVLALGQVAGSRDSSRRAAVGAVLSRVGLEAGIRVADDDIDEAIEAEIRRLTGEAGETGEG
jgi:hypothetical protein